MKTSIVESAEMPKDHYTKFIKQLVDKFQPLYIYSYGKITETTNTAGCFTKESANANNQYYLLMVTESVTRIDHEVQDYANTHYPFGSITIVAHGQQTIRDAINDNNRFFITIYNRGQLLYSHNGLRNLNFNRKFIQLIQRVMLKNISITVSSLLKDFYMVQANVLINRIIPLALFFFTRQ